MTDHKVGTRAEWLAARLKLLEAEKELTRHSDDLVRLRQEMPWVRIEKAPRRLGCRVRPRRQPASAQAFTDGFTAAIGACAALSLNGMIAGLTLPGRRIAYPARIHQLGEPVSRRILSHRKL